MPRARRFVRSHGASEISILYKCYKGILRKFRNSENLHSENQNGHIVCLAQRQVIGRPMAIEKFQFNFWRVAYLKADYGKTSESFKNYTRSVNREKFHYTE